MKCIEWMVLSACSFGGIETSDIIWSYLSADGNKYFSMLYWVSKSVDMIERALLGVDLIK